MSHEDDPQGNRARRSSSSRLLGARKLPFLVSVAGLLCVLWMAFSLREDLRRREQRESKLQLENVKAELDRELSEYGHGLIRAAHRWSHDRDCRSLPAGWEADIGGLMRDFVGLHGVFWITEAGEVVCHVDKEKMASGGPEALAANGWRYDEADASDEVVLTHFVDGQNVDWLTIIAPVRSRDLVGLAALFQARDILPSFLKNVAIGYGVSISDGRRELYRRGSNASRLSGHAEGDGIALHGGTWQINVWPLAEERRRNGVWLPLVLAVSGSVGVGLLALVLGSAQTLERQRERLRQANLFVDSILENLPDMIFVKDARDLKFVRLNKAGEELLGYPRAELIGKSDSAFFPKSEAEFFIAKDREVLARKELLEIPEEHIHTREKGVRLLHTKKIPILDERGGPIYLLGISEDVTERKEVERALEASEALLRQVLEILPVGVWISDASGQIVISNTAAAEIWGGAPHVGMDGYDRYKAWWAETGKRIEIEEWPLVRALRRGEPVRDALMDIESFDGIRKTVLNSAVPLYDSEQRITGGIVVNVDVSERVSAERELRKIRDNLERLVLERTATAEQRAQELARSNAELRQFAYVSSHDLQEPLRMVTSFSQLLARRYLEQLDSDADEFIGYIVEGADRMQQLINALLDYSRVDSRGTEPRVINAGTALAEVLVDLQRAIQETNALVQHDPLPTVRADPVQLRQVFLNLIGNALKFHSSGPPAVHVSATRRDREWVFAVRDNGIGIEPQYCERIFLVFQRLHTRQSYPGTGMGLSICKKIIERHGGRIWVESEPGHGSAFFFTLPAAD